MKTQPTREGECGGKAGKENIMEDMTNLQFKFIFAMIRDILDGCKDLDEAKNKIKDLIELLDKGK